MDYNLLVDSTILVGEIMLKNGAETYIVEETMDKLLKTTNMKHIEAVVMTTSITVTLSDPELKHITAVSRIHERIMNLNRVYQVSNIVDDYSIGKITLEELFHKLKKLKTFNQYNKILKDISLIFIPPLFTIMLNGRWIDALAAVFCGIVLVLMNKMFIFVQTNDFIKTLVTMFMATFVAGIFHKFIGVNVESVIIGVMMPFVPGIAVTNAARDFLTSDYMSGTARIVDAIMQALAVAIGVLLAMALGNLVLGGM